MSSTNANTTTNNNTGGAFQNATATAQSYVNMASTMARSPEAAEAGLVAQQNAQEVRSEFLAGDWSLHVLTLLAGGCMVIVSINGFFGKFVTLKWGSAILDLIVFVVGAGLLLVESGVVNTSLFRSTNDMINNNAGFFRSSLQGRGCMLVGTGCIELWQRGFFDILVGCFVIYVGVSYLWMGRRATQKLNQARSSAGQGMLLQEKFAAADVDGKGSLTKEQFRQLTTSMGLDLSKQETEAAFFKLNKHAATSNRLSYEDIQEWWSQGSTV